MNSCEIINDCNLTFSIKLSINDWFFVPFIFILRSNSTSYTFFWFESLCFEDSSFRDVFQNFSIQLFVSFFQTCSESHLTWLFSKKSQAESSHDFDFFYFSSKVSWKWPSQIDFGQNLLDFLWLLYKRVYETTNLTVLNIFGRSILILKIKFFGKNKKSKSWLWLFFNFKKVKVMTLTWLDFLTFGTSLAKFK